MQRQRVGRARGRLWTRAAATAWICFAAAASPMAAAQDFDTTTDPPVKLSFGLDTRVRDVTLHNLLDFDTSSESGKASDAHFYRVRHRIWSRAQLRSGIGLYARFTTEWRWYLDPYESPRETEIIVDNLFLEIPELPLVPAALRIGRFDLRRGEGFLLMDGGPIDGSRSIYQNGVLLEVDAGDVGLGKGSLSIFAIRNLMRDELVLTNDRERPMVEKDETAVGVYTSSSRFGATAESYYIYKEEQRGEPVGGFSTHPDTKLHTLGYRITGELPWKLDVGAEGAYQFGERFEDRTDRKLDDQRSYGAYLWVERSFLALLMPTLQAGVVALSGDDPDTEDRFEAWRPLFSRWPKWSELYIYTLIPEYGRVGDWQNLLSFQFRVGIAVTGKTRLSYAYQRLRALESMSDSAGPLFGEGLTRGDLHIWKLTHELGSAVSAHFLAERFVPGDFYAERQDDAFFLRWEVMVRR